MSTATACRMPPAGGRLALKGRARLRAEMTMAAEPTGCDCGRCSPPRDTVLMADKVCPPYGR